ncbi:MAG: type II toxin-antitoxin system HicA family toxin [Chloroflexi bacterium]|nr:type II toxin-antitoxin system HicA family toxin [Chloroflexota bacterium]
MSKVPSLSYREIILALQRDGWVVVRQRGSHIRLRKREGDRTLNITVPAHRAVKPSTLSHILKDARLDVERFLELL